MNLGTLRDRARALSGIRLQTLRSDEQIDEVLNEAYQEVVALSPWPFLRSSLTVTVNQAQASFETPSGFSEVLSLTFQDDIGNPIRLRQTTMDELDRLDPDTDGEPSFYARIDDRSFQLWPVPERQVVITVRGKAVAEKLSSDSDLPVFDEQFHVIIAYRAASKMLAEEGDDSGRAQMYQSESSMLYSRMQQFYNRSSDVGIFVMGGSRRRSVNGY